MTHKVFWSCDKQIITNGFCHNLVIRRFHENNIQQYVKLSLPDWGIVDKLEVAFLYIVPPLTDILFLSQKGEDGSRLLNEALHINPRIHNDVDVRG